MAHRIPLTLRFSTKFVKDKVGCWLWSGRISRYGYGNIKAPGGGATLLAHRVSYEIHIGPIPGGFSVCHRCDQRRCVNPNHLFLGTNTDNVADMVRKNRQARGDRVAHSKLTSELVALIRSDMRTHGKIARDYGVDRSVIGRIQRNQLWRHLP